MSYRNWSAWLVLGGLSALFVACAENGVRPDGDPVPLPATAALVSAVSAATPGGASPNGEARSALRVAGTVWVSMPPGTDSAGTSVSIRNADTGDSVPTVVMIGGGFDPRGIPARTGDTLLIRVNRRDGTSVTGMGLVPARSRPEVVRVSPANRKTDVPLNPTIIVIFSEPMDSASLGGAITLTYSGGPVPGKVVPVLTQQGEVLQAGFVPDDSLLPQTDYQLSVSGAALDLDGEALRVQVTSGFTTAPPPPSGPDQFTLLGTRFGDMADARFISLRLRVDTAFAFGAMQILVSDVATGSAPEVAFAMFGPTPSFVPAGTHAVSFSSWRPPGRYAFQVQILDTLGNTTTSAPDTITLVQADTGSRLLVKSYRVIEYQYTAGDPVYFYAPELVVADQPGQGGVDIAGFEMLTIPGLSSPFPRAYAVPLPVSDQDTPLFHEVYGDYELSFFNPSGQRFSGGQSTALLVYWDGAGHFYETVLTGDVVAGTLPGTYSGNCGNWVLIGLTVKFVCPVPIRHAVR